MKINHRPGKAAFTLIELLAVITIIVILAGIVVGGMGYVNEKQARGKAQVQIQLLAKSIEDFKLDMGYYPPTTNKTSVSGAAGTGTSSILFKYLYFDSDNDGTGVPADNDQKIYLAELDPLTSKQGWTTGTAGTGTKITDPWGNEFCYRSAKTEAGAANTGTINPDFDLWSMGKDGKTNAGNNSSALTAAEARDDVRN